MRKILLVAAFSTSCELAGFDDSPGSETEHGDSAEAELHAEPHSPAPDERQIASEYQHETVDDQPTFKATRHPREAYDWSRAALPIGFDQDGTPFPLYDKKPRITRAVQDRTHHIHRTVVREGLGIYADRAPLADFLIAASSNETSGQGSQRPLDGRGSVHGLDVRAAYRAGSRLQERYVEAGNELASAHPEYWLGYGPQGQISWLYLHHWDEKGDPRMLADTVISDLTYVRALREKHHMLRSIRITCPEWDDEGETMTTPWNGRRYRVGRPAVDQEFYGSCVEQGELSEAACRRRARKTYQWRVGMDVPESSEPVRLTWWQLKRAANGRPCPPWRGDEYEDYLKQRFERHAERWEVAGISDRLVRRRDLGDETMDDQYELWKRIWNIVSLELDGEPVEWSGLEGRSVESVPYEGPTQEKLRQEKRLAGDRRALERLYKNK